MLPILAAVPGLAIMATAWSAGFFWTWSFTVMPGLDTAAGEHAIGAMRAVNAYVHTIPFVFFCPVPLAALSGVLAWVAGHCCAAGVAFAGLAIYILGVPTVTFAINVPMNDALTAVSATLGTAALTSAALVAAVAMVARR